MVVPGLAYGSRKTVTDQAQCLIYTSTTPFHRYLTKKDHVGDEIHTPSSNHEASLGAS
jgi:hypothetical protein